MVDQQNIHLIDWLTVTSHIDSPETMIQLLCMDCHSFEEMQSGLNGYRKRLHFEGINVLYDGADNMGVCLTMSGQGCRTFETYGIHTGGITWLSLLAEFAEDPDSYNITRIDLAFDDHTGILDMETLLDDTDDHNYVSRSRWWKVEYGSEGSTVYHGSPTSDIRVRIYDKAAERGCQDGEHWIRVELMLRRENAASAVSKILEYLDAGKVFCGILRNYVTYVTPTSDSNRSRWPITEYWAQLIDHAERIRIWTTPGTEYNIFRLNRFLVDQCGGAITCWREIFGLDDLDQEIRMKNVRLSPKYQRLINEFKKKKPGEAPELERSIPNEDRST